jgi:hypothetical protein
VPSLAAGAVPSVKHGVQAIFLRVDHDAVMEFEAGLVVFVDRVQLARASECGGGWLGQFELGASLVANVDAQDHLVWVMWIWVQLYLHISCSHKLKQIQTGLCCKEF